MHQHPRVPPVTASPANSPRTNPMRTNNPRDQDGGSSRSDSGRGTPSEQDIGLAEGDTLLRTQETSGQAKENLAKLSQVVQVGRHPIIPLLFCLLLRLTELLHQSCPDNSTISGNPPTGIRKKFRGQACKQMGKQTPDRTPSKLNSL